MAKELYGLYQIQNFRWVRYNKKEFKTFPGAMRHLLNNKLEDQNVKVGRIK